MRISMYATAVVGKTYAGILSICLLSGSDFRPHKNRIGICRVHGYGDIIKALGGTKVIVDLLYRVAPPSVER